MATELLAAAPPCTDRSNPAIPWTDILGVRISAIDMTSAISTIEQWIHSDHRSYACLCNVHSIMEADKDPAFRDVLNGAGLRCPDGMPLVWLSRQQGHAQVQRVRGADLMLELCDRSQQTGHRHFFYGGADGVAERLVDQLSQRFPALQVAGWHTPGKLAIGELEQPDVLASIDATRPDIVWVGLGCPKQEWWLARHRDVLHAPALLGVGAAFDFHSGTVKEAPLWMQRNGLEWTYRLTQDPFRLWKRYLIDSPRFLGHLVERIQQN